MCGGCGAAQATWADAVLSRAHARSVVARIASGLGRRLVVQVSPSGWTIQRPGAAPTVCRTAAQLAGALVAEVESALADGDEEAFLQRMRATGEHRAVTLRRGDLPARVVRSADEADAPPVPREAVIPAVLHACLVAAAGKPMPRVTLSDEQGPWVLDPSSHAGA